MADYDHNDVNTTESTPLFNTHLIYMKASHFSATGVPHIFKEKNPLDIQVNIAAHLRELETFIHEVSIRLTVMGFLKTDAKNPMDHNEKDFIYKAEVEQAGLFRIEGFSPEDQSQIKNSACPDILFPFAREHIVSQVTKAGFTAPYLAPMDFNAVYKQAEQERKEKATQH